MAMPANWPFWVLFHVFLAIALAVDLGGMGRGSRTVSYRVALARTAAWVAAAAVFAVLIFYFGHAMTGNARRPTGTMTLEFVTCYLLEEGLSVDNLFVFLLIFRYFAVPGELQHKVLYWGIVGALALRALFIFSGVALINRFHWVTYLFGAFLLWVGARLLRAGRAAMEPGKSRVLRFASRSLPTAPDFGGGRFWVVRDGRRLATQLLLVLLVVETTDVLFATDSIPAVIAISRDPFIVYTSNVFAILGLRSLYFALAGMMEKFRFLHYGLAVILMAMGAKMLASRWCEARTALALGFVVLVLAVSVGLSVAFPRRSAA